MAQYLLDTDVCIEIIKQNERVLGKVEAVGVDSTYLICANAPKLDMR